MFCSTESNGKFAWSRTYWMPTKIKHLCLLKSFFLSTEYTQNVSVYDSEIRLISKTKKTCKWIEHDFKCTHIYTFLQHCFWCVHLCALHPFPLFKCLFARQEILFEFSCIETHIAYISLYFGLKAYNRLDITTAARINFTDLIWELFCSNLPNRWFEFQIHLERQRKS